MMGLPFVLLTVLWLGGIALVRFWPLADVPSQPTAVYLALSALALLLLAFFLYRRNALHHGRAALFLAGLAFLLLGTSRALLARPLIDANHIAYYNDRPDVATVTGVINDEPDIRDRSILVRLVAESVRLDTGESVPVGGDMLVILPRYPVVDYGTRLMLHGRVQTPATLPDFDYRDFLAQQGIHSQMMWPRTEVLDEYAGHPFYHILFGVKNYAHATINHLIPPPQSGLLAGMLLGIGHAMPEEMREHFRTAGVSHIIVISGLHVAILAGIFVRLGDPLLGPKGGAITAVVGILLYTLLVGAGPSVVRAAIMGSVYIIAQRGLGRPNAGVGALFLAAFVMTLYDPRYLSQIGFQLSFMATLSIMLFAEPLTNWAHGRVAHLTSRPVANGVINLLSDTILITLAAQLLILPLTMYYFQQVSLVSVLANALILPAHPGVMVWGGLATITGMFSTAVGQIFGWIAYLFLWYTSQMAELLAAIPYALVSVPFTSGMLAGSYALIAALFWYGQQEPERRVALRHSLGAQMPVQLPLFASVGGMLLAGLWYGSLPNGRLQVTFLDVGQGDGIFIQTPSGRQILVDGGYYPSLLLDGLGEEMPFWDRSLDVVIATHADADHVSALPPVLERYEVGELWVSDLPTEGEAEGEEGSRTAVYELVLDTAVGHNIPLYRPQAGEVLLIEDGVRLEILHPPADPLNDNRNDNSLSFRLVYGDFSLLLTGDTEAEGERLMLESGRPLEAMVFKAGHHGAETSSNAFFLEAVRPQVMVVSAGAGNQFGHPHPEVLARATAVGATVLRTDELGTIWLETDGTHIWWWAEKRGGE